MREQQTEKKHMVPMKKKNRKVRLQLARRGGFGLNEVLGIAAALIIATAIVIPGLKTFAGNEVDDMGSWWSTHTSDIFVTETGT